MSTTTKTGSLSHLLDGGAIINIPQGTYAITAHNDFDGIEFVGLADADEVAEILCSDYRGRIVELDNGGDPMEVTSYLLFERDGTATLRGGSPVMVIEA